MKHLRSSTSLALLLTAMGTCTSVLAHEGHGMPGISHWHDTDVWGFLAVGALVALGLWMKGRK
ncbi:MAG: hypothetical protein QM742_07305 [Aquabacterium sp.]